MNGTDPSFGMNDIKLRDYNSVVLQREQAVNDLAKQLISNPLDLDELLTQQVKYSPQLMRLLINSMTAIYQEDRAENFEEFRRAALSIAQIVADERIPGVDYYK